MVRYEIYADGTLVGNTTGLSFADTDLSSGTTPACTVRAIDAGGNPVPASNPASVSVPSPLAKIANGEFDSGAAPWQADAWNGGALTFTVDNTNQLSGADSAKCVVTGTGTAWHVQLRQFLYSKPGKTYRLRFSVKADAAASVDVVLQQSHSPYSSILTRTVGLTAAPQSFNFTNTGASAADTLYVTFMLGRADGRTIWIDDVRVEEY